MCQKCFKFYFNGLKSIGLIFREKSGAEWTDVLLDMYIETPVAEWGTILRSADFPSLRTGMCGFFATTLTLFFPPDTVDMIVDILFDSFAE